jgi:geranylgeranyl pyrophosphate synthase
VSVALEELRAEIDRHLAVRLPPPGGDDPLRLREAMRYAVLSGGKRLRPVVVLLAARAALPGVALDGPLLDAACALELVHCYSLVHDDLPAMDDDDERRGRPTCHRVFGEACALLVGNALLTLAFEWLAEAGEASGRPEAFSRASLALARGAGHIGMVGGQARDLALAGRAPDLATLERLHEEKTAGLFTAATTMGGALGGAGPDVMGALSRFGHAFGVAFQHVDDLDDAEHAEHADQARARARALCADAAALATALDSPALAGLAHGLTVRL